MGKSYHFYIEISI